MISRSPAPWAATLSPAALAAVPTSDWYIGLSDHAKEIVDEAIGYVEAEEIEPPSEEEVAALEEELAFWSAYDEVDHAQDELEE